MKKRKVLYISLAVLFFLLALGIMLYPVIGNHLAEKNKSLVMTEYSDAVEELTDTGLEELLSEARAYNAALSPVSVSVEGIYTRDGLMEAQEHYADILAVNANGIMAKLDIPVLGVSLPIYHGTDGETLEKGVGHLLGSSFPVGGKSTHAVLTGHSGLAREKMLNDLEAMKEGDRFYIHVLDQTLAYEVREIHTVLPEDTSYLAVRAGEDMCTLITCTPYGLNTHRLLVQGYRIPYTPESIPDTIADVQEPESRGSGWQQQYFEGLKLGVIAADFIALTYVVIHDLRHERRRKKHSRK